MSVPIATSPGRGGFGPDLSLGYSSGGGDGPFGIGWNLGIPSITRKTDRGIPQYCDSIESDVFILSGAEDLVPDDENPAATQWGEAQWGEPWGGDGAVVTGFVVERYRPRVEGLFARIERYTDTATDEVHWRATTRDNVTSFYGETAQARVVDPEHPERIFRWLLEKTVDDRGNVITYEYKQEDLNGVDQYSLTEHNRLVDTAAQSQRYLKRIKYGNTVMDSTSAFLFEVVFDYGEHGTWDGPSGELDVSPSEDRDWPTRADTFSTYRSGFEIRTRRLCRRVLMFHRIAALDTSPYLVSSTDFDYEELPTVTYLKGVTQRGYIKNDVSGRFIPSEIPTLDFEYSRPVIGTAVQEVDPDSLENLPIGVDGSTFRLVDLDGEGLPGILTEQAGGWYYKRGNGSGSFAPMIPVAQQASAMALGSGAQLMDLDGDGQRELVQFVAPTPGFYERTTDEGWDNFRAFRSVPNIDWQDPNLQLIDVSGDGFPDVLIAKDNHFIWYRSKGTEGFDEPRRVMRPKDERAGPAIVFADPEQSISLADMSGDGLTDIVRIRNGEVCYWPSRGHGRFGRKITMSGSPVFDLPDQFRADRVRLADLDGTGTTDIVYLGRGVTKLWFNQAGNGFAAQQTLDLFPDTDSITSVQVVDLQGTGTACMVWSSPRGESRPGTIKFIELMADGKPHLLRDANNNMGLRTQVQYAPSTKYYLMDRAEGKPWVTKLPFPVQVIERVEALDEIAKTKLVNHFRYHHGHFDGVEREFRGFAMVEQWDTESFEDFGGTGLFTFDLFETVESNLHAPPVHTKTWFHTGAYLGSEAIGRQLETEYFDVPTAEILPDTRLPTGLTGHERREAARALKSTALRQEIYALDGSTDEGTPYTTTETNFGIVMLQARGDRRHGVFLAHERETLTYTYERNTTDPRIGHSMVLEVDTYGNPTKTVQIAYGKGSSSHTEQTDRKIIYTHSEFAQLDTMDTYRVGVPFETTIYEITTLSDTSVPLQLETLQDAVEDAEEISYDTVPGTQTLRKRIVDRTRTYYYEDDLSGVLPLGQAGERALVYETRSAAMTTAQITSVFSTDVTDTMLENDGGYVKDENIWWIVSGRQVFDALGFYVPTSAIDPFGNTYTTTWDTNDLLIEDVTDPESNVVSADNDYRVLQPSKITDPNGNRTEVEFDGLGVVVKTAVMGKTTESLGDTLTDPTSEISYDLFDWQDNGEPNWIKSRMRETHDDTQSAWQEAYAYFDGSGRVAMTKVQAEPGMAYDRDVNGDLVLTGGNPTLVDTSPDIRWVGSGRTVYDNKGNPVKQYEPYFSSIPDYEDEDELVAQGVTPVLHYDPLGRLVRTDLPNGTYSKVEFDAWSQSTFDPNDTVLDSDWYDDRFDYSGTDEALLGEKDAALKAADHDDTPTVTRFDVLGRPFMVIEDLGGTTTAETKTVFDIDGNPLEVIDARTNTAEERVFGIAGQVLKTISVDAGDRRILANVTGAPIRAWNDRDYTDRFVYDTLNRPTHQYVTPPVGAEQLVVRTVYGEELATGAADDNLLGQVYRVYDAAGELTNEEYDFKGNLLQQSRKLSTEYETTQDWIALATETTVSGMATAAASDLSTEAFTTSTSYDALNRPLEQTTPDDSVVQLTYNEASLLQAVDVKLRGATTATAYVTNIDYDAKGQRELIEYDNDSKTTYTYDPETFRLARLKTERTTDSAVLQDLQYHYDPVGNITRIRDDAQQTVYYDNTVVSPDQDFTYDALYRLTEATGREHTSLGQSTDSDLTPGAQPHTNDPSAMRTYTQAYVYDLVGNISQMQHTATSGNWTRDYVYATDGNRLLRNSAPGETAEPYSHTYTYDAHGNMTAMPHLTELVWDHADRMQEVDLGGGGSVYFVYDAAGQRVRKVHVNQAGTTVKERVYLGGLELYRETTNSTLQLERESLHVSDDTGRICLVETKTVENATTITTPTSIDRFQYGNHLGSAALELDGSASVISYEEYHPFGTSSYRVKASGIDVSERRYRYTGKERDEETGLYYHEARYYACWLGRWTASDPIGLGDGVNRYRYARNKPTGFNDPSGLLPPADLPHTSRFEQAALQDQSTVEGNAKATKEALTSALKGFARDFKEDPAGTVVPGFASMRSAFQADEKVVDSIDKGDTKGALLSLAEATAFRKLAFIEGGSALLGVGSSGFGKRALRDLGKFFTRRGKTRVGGGRVLDELDSFNPGPSDRVQPQSTSPVFPDNACGTRICEGLVNDMRADQGLGPVPTEEIASRLEATEKGVIFDNIAGVLDDFGFNTTKSAPKRQVTSANLQKQLERNDDVVLGVEAADGKHGVLASGVSFAEDGTAFTRIHNPGVSTATSAGDQAALATDVRIDDLVDVAFRFFGVRR